MKQHNIQHIAFEYGIVVAALPRGEVIDIHSGQGSMCPWNEKQMLEACKGIRAELDKVIAELEAGV